MSLINTISELVILPISDLITGQSIYKSLLFLKKSQNWSKEEIHNFQNERLKKLINNSYSYVPYYRGLFDELRLSPNDINSLEDLYKIPILTKAIIKSKGIEQFTSNKFPIKKYIKSSSSGSTGEPLFYYITKEAYSLNIASSLRGWYWMGYRLGDKYIKLSQNSRSRNIKKLQDIISRNLYLATNPLIESNFEFILNETERYKPKIIRSYPDPLLFLARYRNQNNIFHYNPVAITTTGNTLHPETRKEIEDAFKCKVFDSYSCEGNSTVFECPTHECYHSSEEYGISEILDENGNEIKSGIGRLVSTDLWNFAHPFIRYDTQDYVEVDSSPCSCGSSLLKIKKILGRDNDVLVMQSGRRFIVHNFTGFFQVDSVQLKRSIEQFQVIKKSDGSILFRLVVNEFFSEEVSSYIKKFWENEMNAQVIIEKVENIPLGTNGKRKFILNE